MEKQFSGWSRNKFVNCKFFEPKSLIVIEGVWGDLMEIVP